jgi:hypothetical protein
MKVTVDINLRKKIPLPHLHAMYRKAVSAIQTHDRMGPGDPSRPTTYYEHSRERFRLLEGHLERRRVLLELAELFGPEVTEKIKALKWAKEQIPTKTT